MTFNIWTITGGSNKERVQKLVDSLDGNILHILNYGKDPLGIDKTVEFCPDDMQCPIANDTRFTANFNRILWNEIHGKNEAVLILNDDTEFEAGALDALVTAAEKYPDHWMSMNPVQVAMNNPKKILMAGTGRAYPAGEHMGGSAADLTGEVTRWRWLPFCAPLINLDAVRIVGLLNPTMRMWFSDSDYCIRSRYLGYDVALASESIIKHINHASAQAGESEELSTIFRADQAAFARTWNGDPLKDISS